MFIGHFAVGFASKRVAPRASLAPLLGAPLLLDLLWPVFLLLGIEQVRINPPGGNPLLALTFTSYPWSHSLLMTLVWAGLFGGGYYALTRYATGAWVLAAGVASHWVLDGLTHVADLPLAPGGGPLVGAGMWQSVTATVVIESALYAAGVWVYTSATRARDSVGRYAWGALVALMAAAYVWSLRSPPPPSVFAVAWAGIVASVFTLWLAWWADRHRTAKAVGERPR